MALQYADLPFEGDRPVVFAVFFGRWVQESAKRKGFATAEVQISETETPLHRLETVYRRLCERLATADTPHGALRNVIDAWFYTLEEDALAEGGSAPEGELLARTTQLLEQRHQLR